MSAFSHVILTSAGAAWLAGLTASATAAQTVTEPVVVTATRTAQTADATLASVQVITREQIEQAQASDVAQLLRFQAGLDISRNGGPGQTTSLFMRGTDSNQTLVLIDGVKVNPGTIGGAAWQNINPAVIERIEIVRGPRSTLYGSDAIGGVVQIFTRRGRVPFSHSASLGLGSDATFSGTVGIGGKSERFRAGLDLAVETTDGIEPRTDSDASGDFNNYSFNLYAGRQFGGIDVDFVTWWTQGNTDYADFFGAPLDQDFQNSVSALTFDTAPLENLTSTFKLSYTIDKVQQTQDDDIARTRRWVADWQNNLQLGNSQLLSGGLSLTRENDYSVSLGSRFDEDRNVKAAFVQDDIQYGRHKLLLAARYTDDDFTRDKSTWSIAYGYHLLPGTRVFASAATAFRSPDSTDLFGFGGNPELRPEQSRNYEAGLKQQFSGAHSLQITAFQNKIKDLIAIDFATFPSEAENIDRARIRGIEAQYQFQRGNWYATLEGILQDPENRETGQQLARRAKKTLTGSINYTHGPYTFTGKLLTTGKRPNSDFDETELDGYTLVDLMISRRLNRSLSAHLRIDNLFDEHYTLAEGYNTEDRAFFVTLSYSSAPAMEGSGL
jgi:vitamin B12 transporter